MFLHVGGTEINEIYRTLTFPPLADDCERTLADVLEAFDEHFRPYKNLTHASYMFNSLQQKAGQSFDQFVAEVKLRAQECAFGTAQDRIVKDRLIQGIRDNALRERFLREGDISLKAVINRCKAAEVSKTHSEAMKQNEEVVHAMRHDRTSTAKTSFKKSAQRSRDGREQTTQPACSRCGSRHRAQNCPAYGKTCFNCNKKNHFATVCNQPKKQQQRRQVQALFEADDEAINLDVLSVDNPDDDSEAWIEKVYLDGHKTFVKLDTGAQVNVI